MFHIKNQGIRTAEMQVEDLMKAGQNGKLLAVHAARISAELSDLGVNAYDFKLPEAHALRYLINPGEHILGIVFGSYTQTAEEQAGRGALAATNKRVFLIDRKPLFAKLNELSYQSISGVAYSRVGLAGTVTLHSRIGDIRVRTFNQKCARSFVRSIEAKIFDDEKGRSENDQLTQERNL